MQYYVGIDGGGTKTAVCAVAADGSDLRSMRTIGSSWREHGADKVAAVLQEAIGSLLQENAANVAGIAMGLPCYGESDEGDRLLVRALKSAFGGTPLYFTNDVEVGWAGSLALEPGVNIVAGTGSIAFGEDMHGNTARSGGWGEYFGDEGSCYWMGLRVLQLFSKQADGRMEQDALYTTVREEFGLQNDLELIDVAYSQYIPFREKVARLQLLAEKAAAAGAPSAKALYDEAVRELCLVVSAVKDRLDFGGKPWPVSYSGGLFKAREFVLPAFSRAMGSLGGVLQQPRFEPVEGAVLLAFQRFYPDGLPSILAALDEQKRRCLDDKL